MRRLPPFLNRWRYRLMNIYARGDDLNRRVDIERKLFACASGKRPPPTPQECREWALHLGVPAWARESE